MEIEVNLRPELFAGYQRGPLRAIKLRQSLVIIKYLDCLKFTRISNNRAVRKATGNTARKTVLGANKRYE